MRGNLYGIFLELTYNNINLRVVRCIVDAVRVKQKIHYGKKSLNFKEAHFITGEAT